MANRTATLYIRITQNGRNSFCKPVYQSKGRLKPQYAMVDGEPEHHKEGVYYVRFGEHRVDCQRGAWAYGRCHRGQGKT
jgi:hypothetical protein